MKINNLLRCKECYCNDLTIHSLKSFKRYEFSYGIFITSLMFYRHILQHIVSLTTIEHLWTMRIYSRTCTLDHSGIDKSMYIEMHTRTRILKKIRICTESDTEV